MVLIVKVRGRYIRPERGSSGGSKYMNKTLVLLPISFILPANYFQFMYFPAQFLVKI
jgi:hypothetical protein